ELDHDRVCSNRRSREAHGNQTNQKCTNLHENISSERTASRRFSVARTAPDWCGHRDKFRCVWHQYPLGGRALLLWMSACVTTAGVQFTPSPRAGDHTP
ncbi:MAG: hypothetical protein KAX54_06275, partial [Thauera sp.]|nr:hypothetical protein [Thauera sp.]